MTVTASDVAFFHEHAGWSYDPATETSEEGRARCAVEAAQDEAWGKSVGLTFSWVADWGVDHVKEFDCYDQEPETCETVLAYDAHGEIVASLGCVDDATPEYRRVIEAELASEAHWQAEEAAARVLSDAWVTA